MIYEKLLEDYCRHLAAKGYAQGTISWRKSYLKALFVYLAERDIHDPKEVTTSHIKAYKVYLKETHRTPRGGELAESTYSSHITAFTDFFRWLERSGQILMTPVPKQERRKKPKPLKLPQVMTEEEALKILESCPVNTLSGIRDRAILEILYSTGVRRQELVNLNVDDVFLEKQELRVNLGKGKKDRIVPLGEYACKYTEFYLKYARIWLAKSPKEKALFLSTMNGERLNKGTVEFLVQKAVQRSGVKTRVTPHTFRHTMATHLLRNQADLRHIQAILGHSDLRSTEVYTHLAKEDVKEAVKKAHPRGKR